MTLELQITLISASSAIVGSLIGGGISYLTNKNLNRQKWELERVERLASSKELLYAEFLAEGGRQLMQSIEKKVSNVTEFQLLFSLLSRIRLVATDPVAQAADALTKQILRAHQDESHEKASKDTPKDVSPAATISSFTNLAKEEIKHIRQNISV